MMRWLPGSGASRRAAWTPIVLLVIAGFLAGCLGRSPLVDHYVLGAHQGPASNASDASGAYGDLAVLVGPVRLPAYLERAQMATLGPRGEIELAEFQRWLGGFEENFLRAISLGLAHELGSIKVVSHPSKPPFALDYRVRLHVDDLVLLEEQQALRTRIRWALVREQGDAASDLFLMEDTRPLAENSTAGLVAAHDTAITELVTRIARRIAELEGSP